MLNDQVVDVDYVVVVADRTVVIQVVDHELCLPRRRLRG
jgi:hypothetical protein